LALTLGAAGLTLLVIIGILTGPSVVNCFTADIGMGQCLRDSMTNAGLLPRPALADTAPAASDQPAAIAATPQPAAGTDTPATASTTPADAPSDSVVAANFGLLRAEPDGSVVIAGSGTPGSEVQVFANDDLLGSVTVEPSGDWVLVPEKPLPAGGLEITLGEAGKTGRAEDSFVVAINEDKLSEPLVVASTPGAASEILQGVEPPTQLAAADPVTAPTAPPADVLAAASPVEPPAATPATAASPTQPAPVAAAATTPPASADAPAAQVPAPEPAAAASATITPAPVTSSSATPAPAAVASAQPAPTPTAPVQTAANSSPPTIDAIEIEGNKTFFGGAGPEGGDIRLYVDDAFIDDAKVADGRWLVEAGPVLKNPRQRIRVDLLESGTAKVASRAEVNFEVELPASAPVAVATAPTSTPAPNPSPSLPDGTAAAPPPAATAPAAPAVAAAPAAAAPMPAANPAPSAPDETTAAAADIPTMVATSVGDPDAARFAAGKAIIRRGDNLWTIARRVYGRGIRYTTIYEANTGQIRDPDRIYPGQIFALPENPDD